MSGCSFIKGGFVAICLMLLFSGSAGSEQHDSHDYCAKLKQIPLGPLVLDLGGSLRLRYEYVENYNRKSYGTEKNDGFFLERFRLEATISYHDRANLFIQFQDAHIFDYDLKDREFLSNPNEDEADLQQAYLEIKPFSSAPVFLKLGRQIFAYGDDRLFGPGDWGNTGRVVWDAVKLSWKTDRFFLHGFYGRTLIHDDHSFNMGHDHDKEAAGAYGSLQFQKDNALDLFYFVELDRDKDTRGEDNMTDTMRIHTVGARTAGKVTWFDYDATYARQFGRWGNDRVKAWALHAGIGYSAPLTMKQRLGIDYCYASGDDDPFDGDHETFEPAFGSRDRHYGWMNLFSWRNLVNWQFSLSLEPHKKLKLIFDYHVFRLAEARDAWYSTGPAYRRDKSGQSGRKAGTEIDMTVLFKATKRLDLRTGYAHFFPGDYVKRTGTHKPADWVHVQWMYRF